MPTIYIRDPKTTLAVDSAWFTLRSEGRRIGRIPPTMIEQVILEHGVEVTRTALDRLGTLGVPVTFLGKGGRVQARLVAPWKPEPLMRLGQAAAYFDTGLRLQLARRWVDAKLANSAAVLKNYLSNHKDDDLSSLWRELRASRDRLQEAPDLASLRGFEGCAAKLWFSALGRMLRAPWLTFSGRNRKPPRDPGNAVLSYSYGVLAHQLHACSEAVGLDPYIGYLHVPDDRRPSLVMDLLEPFRPALGDRLMLRLLNLGTLKEGDFHQPDGPQNGVRITAEGRAAILQMLASWVSACDEELGDGMPSPGGLLLKEVERFGCHARENTLHEFMPWYLRPEDARQ